MFEKCLYFNSNALARTVTRLWTKAYSEFDLSPAHAFLLRVVLDKPGLLPRELADELKLSRSTITRFLDSLEKRDLLLRQSAKSDGRELHVYPTKKLIKIHQQLDDTGKKLSKLMSELVGEENLVKIVNDVREVQQVLKLE